MARWTEPGTGATFPFSLPFADAAELGTPRAEVRLYRELTLMRLLPVSAFVSAFEMDDLLDAMRAGSGKRYVRDSGLWVPAIRRGVVSMECSTSTAKSLGEYGMTARSSLGFQDSEPVEAALLWERDDLGLRSA